ncbi:acyltransferase [Nitrosomonas sp. PY1]|uniref:acyltransferase family protein n=1 Tax=Nitrosomonas sp. PY1 TaxID=1803906 RepID=UPI001FC7F124|nr:acyltransferase [Nitrosomonas sp. PY1]
MTIYSEKQSDTNYARINELDLFRFLAALAVVFHHFSLDGFAIDSMTIMPYSSLASISKYGYLGVELFFIMSGFVILMTASNGSLKKFTISRLVRLYPAFWVCCTITFVITLAIGAPEYFATLRQYLINMTMLSEFFGVPPMDGVYWSLFVELRFYALIIILLIFGRIHQIEFFIVFWLIAVITLEFFPNYWLRYFFITDYAVFFIAGAAFFLIWAKGITWIRSAVIAITWIYAVYLTTDEVHEVEARIRNDLSPYVIASIISTFFAVMLLVSFKRTGVLGHLNWAWIGALTYPLYLIHQNIGFMIYNTTYTAFNPHALFWGLVIGILMLAYTIHIYVEKPLAKTMRNHLNKFTSNSEKLIQRITSNQKH